MPRKKTEYSDIYPYHVTNRSNNREYFYVDQKSLWEIFDYHLRVLHVDFKCEIIAFVLMSNHYHLLIQTPLANIGDSMLNFHREVSRAANRRAKRINHFFGGRYKWSIIKKNEYFMNCYKYVYRNPVRAGICQRVDKYFFSTLNQSTEYLSREYEDLSSDLKWLNRPFLKETEEAIAKGLRRKEFKLSKIKSGYLPELDYPSR